MKRMGAIAASTWTSIGTAAIIFVIIGVVFDILYKGNYQMVDYSFTKMAVGSLVIGLGFGLPTFVYENDRLSLLVQTLIHMGIGCIVMTIVAFAVGWIPTDRGMGAILATILGEVAISFIVWMFFYLHQLKIAKEMNKRISELNSK